MAIKVYKSLIRSKLDYLFIEMNTSTQKILGECQKIQNRILKQIKFYPFKTRIAYIHSNLKIELLEPRSIRLFEKFVSSRSSHKQINEDLNNYEPETRQKKFFTLFDTYFKKFRTQNE